LQKGDGEMIKELAFEIDKNIRKKYKTEVNFCIKTERNPRVFNNTLRKMKKGGSINLRNFVKILEDLNLGLTIVEDKKYE
jgi:hypothetical protein